MGEPWCQNHVCHGKMSDGALQVLFAGGDGTVDTDGHYDCEDADLEWKATSVVEGSEGSALYTGQWRGAMRQGNGVLERADGGRYEGAFRCNQAHGEGRFTSAA